MQQKKEVTPKTKVQTGLRISVVDREVLEKLAELNGVSVNSQITIMLKPAINKYLADNPNFQPDLIEQLNKK